MLARDSKRSRYCRRTTAGPEARPRSEGRNDTASQVPTASASLPISSPSTVMRFFAALIGGGHHHVAAGTIQLRLDVEPKAATAHLLVRGSAKRAEQYRVVDCLQQIGLALGVGAEQDNAARRSLPLQVGQIPIPSGDQVP